MYRMTSFNAKPEHGVVWITGASSGIGRALALEMARRGYTVAATARDHDRLVELQEEAGALKGAIHVLDGDVTERQDMERVIASIEYEHGRIALAVFNAGVFEMAKPGVELRRAFEKSIAVNLTGVVNCLVPSLRHMQTYSHGQIAFMGSAAGYAGLPGSAAYGATKAALINMAQSLALDLEGSGIFVQLINPGFVETPMTASMRTLAAGRITAEEAARRIADGLRGQAFEIAFPRRQAFAAKLLGILPYALYFPLLRWLRGKSVARQPKSVESTLHAAE
jgi:NAD(P)-dependent dehydrogenase (short-subunit alcohol dehydrogenase family)